MFGGCGSGKQNSFNDLNKYDMDTKLWIKLEATGEVPPPREAHIAHAFDNDKMFIFGGVN
jgi:N-acetylneuraminic acid mutarotase